MKSSPKRHVSLRQTVSMYSINDVRPDQYIIWELHLNEYGSVKGKYYWLEKGTVQLYPTYQEKEVW
jgi:hypothetical protein